METIKRGWKINFQNLGTEKTSFINDFITEKDLSLQTALSNRINNVDENKHSFRHNVLLLQPEHYNAKGELISHTFIVQVYVDAVMLLMGFYTTEDLEAKDITELTTSTNEAFVILGM